jgi:hypothetical protein
MEMVILMVFVGTARKRQDTSARIVRYAKPNNLDLGLGLGKNAPHVARMDTLMLNVGKNSLIKLLNGTRI